MKSIKDILVDKMQKATLFSAVLLSLLFFNPVGSAAQEIVDADPELPGIQQPLASVKVDGIELFNVRGISTFTPEQRAAAISKRIMQAAADTSISADSIRLIVEKDHTQVFAGTKFIMNVFEADASVEAISRELFTKVVSQATTEAIQTYRKNRTRPVLIRKSLNALGTLIVLTLLITAVLWIFRRINRGLQNFIKTKIDSVENKSYKLIRADQLWKTYYLVFKALKIVIIVVLAAASVNYILGLLPWTSNAANYILKLLLDPILSHGKGILNFLPSLAFLIVIYLVARYLIKLGKLFFSGLKHNVIKIKNFDPDWAMPTYSIFRTLVIVFSVIVAFPYIPGSGTSAFKGISVFIGVLFSLGSSSFISNLIAGYTMTYRGAFKKGDFIQAGDKIRLRSGKLEYLDTRLLSIQNEEIVIPNSVF